MDDRSPSHQLDKFNVRMPAGMRERIRAAVERENNSMNAQCVALLAAALQAYEYEGMIPSAEQLRAQADRAREDAAGAARALVIHKLREAARLGQYEARVDLSTITALHESDVAALVAELEAARCRVERSGLVVVVGF